MKTSILFPVHDREAAVVLSSVRSIARCARAGDEFELIVANDRSNMSYDWLVGYLKAHEVPFTWLDVAGYDAFRMDEATMGAKGHNGPSRAFNEALAASDGERVIAMSSDVIVTPGAWKAALATDVTLGMWSPKVWDLDGNPFREYCGPTRVFPMPWFLVMSRQTLVDVGGWDESYLQGLSYDDNDVAGRVALGQGRFFLDYEATVFHHSHATVYDETHRPEIKAALDRNRDWTMHKWSGVPFEGAVSPFSVLRRPHPSGRIAFECLAPEGRLEQAVKMTTGMFAPRAVTA